MFSSRHDINQHDITQTGLEIIQASFNQSYIFRFDHQKPTEDAVNTKLTELTNEYPMKLLREERDRRIATSDWRVTKAKETSTNVPTAWKTYRQALRDLPASSTPTLNSSDYLDMSSVTWPTEPS